MWLYFLTNNRWLAGWWVWTWSKYPTEIGGICRNPAQISSNTGYQCANGPTQLVCSIWQAQNGGQVEAYPVGELLCSINYELTWIKPLLKIPSIDFSKSLSWSGWPHVKSDQIPKNQTKSPRKYSAEIPEKSSSRWWFCQQYSINFHG